MKKIVFLTGAGISAESGIPTFRSAVNGIWENYQVEEVATHKAIVNNPDLVYKFCNELRNKYAGCLPNSAHKMIADLEKDYEVYVITQNIDNLHEQAGSSNVLHLHGEINKVRSVNNHDLLFDCTEPYTYVILDDDSDMLESQLPYFVQTDWMKRGLSQDDAEQAIKILNENETM